MGAAYVLGVGQTRFGRLEDDLVGLMERASVAAMRDAGVDRVDAVVVGSQTSDVLEGVSNLGSRLCDRLSMVGAAAWRVENSMATGSAVLESAVHAVRSGAYETVLAVGGESLTGHPTGVVARALASVLAPQEVSLGMTMPAMAALVARSYMEEHALSREMLALVPVKAHSHAARNPNAHFQKAVSVEGVLGSPMVADPLRVFDCAPVSDGAAAAVVTSEGTDVEVAGVGHGTDAVALADRWSHGILATRIAAGKALEQAGLGVGDVDVFEVHDAFSILELIAYEDLGLYPRGEGWTALELGRTSLGGETPVNVSGGVKARGHPVGATGLAQVCELTWQLRGEAGRRQVDGARVGLAENKGGFACNNVVTVLGRVDR